MTLDPLVACCLTAIIVLAGCMAGADKEVAHREPAPVIRHSWGIAPGQFGEINLHIDAGDEIRVVFNATRSVDWEIHSHDGAGASIVHARGRDVNATREFTAPGDGDYGVMWTNRAPPDVTFVDAEIHGRARLLTVTG